MTGGAAEGAASSAVEPAASAAPAPAGAAASAPARPAAKAVSPEPAYTGPPPAARPRRERIPAWAMPVLAILPLWAILYGGAFGERPSEEAAGPIAAGAGVYRSAGCSGCHGPTGGGGVGPAMADVATVFPDFADHVAWIETGSQPVKGQPYGATGKIATGGMPGFGDSLSEEDIIAVVCHERVTLGKQNPAPEECADTGPDAEGTGGEDTESADIGG